MALNIIIPMYNVEKEIQHNIMMLKKQSYDDFRCIMINDMSTDNTADTVRKSVAEDSRFELVNNESRKFALRNISESITALNPGDEDVQLLIDGDDSLLHPNALETVIKTYEATNCWMTYGSHMDEHDRLGDICKPYPEHILAGKKVRKFEFRVSHPRSFKTKLWKQIRADAFFATESELKAARIRMLLRGNIRTWFHWRHITPLDILDTSGRFFRRCYDKAIFYPMLEMAVGHAEFIQEPIYQYNKSNNPLPYDSRNTPAKWLTRCIRSIVISKPAYDPI